MRFTNGDDCHGKNRSVEVEIICGKEDRIIKVDEEKMCEYRVEFETVVGCYNKKPPSLDPSQYRQEL